MFTIDASVWVAAELPAEPGFAESHAFVDAVISSRTPVYLPTLMRVEVAGTLARAYGNGTLAHQYASTLATMPFVYEFAIDAAVAARAGVIAAVNRLRGADAVYAAVAVASGCVLVSLDNQHLIRLGSLVRVLTPAAALPMVGRPRP